MTASGRQLYIGVTSPTVNDDSTLGYNVGDEWYYNQIVWLCVDSTPGAANWQILATGDFLNPLALAEVVITGTTGLTSTAFGKMHKCTATSAAYTITLPTAVGYAGKFISFRFDSSNTYIVTIDGNASELINAKLTRPYVHNEQLTIMSDGANWCVMNESLIQVGCNVTAAAPQSIPDDSNTKVQLNTESYDNDTCFDSVTNYRFQPKAPGLYSINIKVIYVTATANRYLDVSITHSTLGNIILSAVACSVNGATYVLNGTMALYFNGSTEYLEMYVRHIQGGARNIQYPILIATRLSNV